MLHSIESRIIYFDESNVDDVNADINFPGRGLYVVPSKNVPDRDDITGYVLTSSDKYGKVKWTKSSIGSLGDLSDVFIENLQVNQYIQYDGEKWINVSGSPTVSAGDGLTEVSNVFNVNVDDVTIEIINDKLEVKQVGNNQEIL